jgi:hypothetical protein
MDQTPFPLHFPKGKPKQNPCLNTFPTVAKYKYDFTTFHLGILPKNPDFSNYFISDEVVHYFNLYLPGINGRVCAGSVCGQPAEPHSIHR